MPFRHASGVKSSSVNSISNLSRTSKRLHDRRSDLSNTFVKKFRVGTRQQRDFKKAKEKSDLSRASLSQRNLLENRYKHIQKANDEDDSATQILEVEQQNPLLTQEGGEIDPIEFKNDQFTKDEDVLRLRNSLLEQVNEEKERRDRKTRREPFLSATRATKRVSRKERLKNWNKDQLTFT